MSEEAKDDQPGREALTVGDENQRVTEAIVALARVGECRRITPGMRHLVATTRGGLEGARERIRTHGGHLYDIDGEAV